MTARQRIVDATLALIRDGGFSAISIAAVAQEAGVSRQTVYSTFGTKENMVSDAVGGVAVDVLGEISARVAGIDDSLDYVVEFVVAARTALRGNDVLMVLLSSTENNPIFEPDVVVRAKPIVRGLLGSMFDRSPGLQENEDEVLELVARLGLSIMVYDTPASADDEGLRRVLRAPLGAVLGGRS